MTAQTAANMTPQEYLVMERQNADKSEYVNGDMLAMAGTSRWHNLMVTNLVAELRTQLKGRPCEVYPSDMRVWIPRLITYTYPDVVVVCGQPEFQDERRDTLLNPTLLIEVLSPTTAAYDRGVKFKHYRALDSLQEYLLVSQDAPLLGCYLRQEGSRFWTFSDAEGPAAQMELSSVGCRLALAEVYDKVEFEQTEMNATREATLNAAEQV
jgi:Uma2 family endonuclease